MDQVPTPLAAHRAGAAGAVWQPLGLAAGAGLVAFAVGSVAESAIIRAVHGNRRELEWLSDAVISLALASVTYLWLRLRTARMRVLTMTREQTAIEEQLLLAAAIQRDLLPVVPEATPGFRWAAGLIPAGRIGGDFYDFFRPVDGTVLAMVADVSGKGIPAALILSSLKSLFRTVARETVDPATIAERIAGHPAGYLLLDGTITAALESGGPPLGLLAGARYATSHVELRAGNIGVLVTDGITEALEAGPMTLSQVLCASHEAGGSPARLCAELLKAAALGPGPAGVPDWQDDRTVFVFAVDEGV